MAQNEGYVSTSDGVRLYFLTQGSGDPIVLVPNGFHLLEGFQSIVEGRTLVFYDVRNRGRSDAVPGAAKLEKGIHNDVDDLDAVRRHFGADRVDVIGHSYVGITVALYAMKYAARARRVVQIGPSPPDSRKQYPPHLKNEDATWRDVLGRLAELQKERAAHDPEAFCRKTWTLLAPLFVADPANAGRIRWGRCELRNERSFMKYWMEILIPSIQKLALTAEDLASVKATFLTVHGTLDRSSPYGGGRDWARLLPNARLLTVEKAAHVPWVEAPEQVVGSIRTFLDGAWPEGVETVDE